MIFISKSKYKYSHLRCKDLVIILPIHRKIFYNNCQKYHLFLAINDFIVAVEIFNKSSLFHNRLDKLNAGLHKSIKPNN